ncbi:MAG: DUF362 domain-containing protein [Isosphaeraceae bacterium]
MDRPLKGTPRVKVAVTRGATRREAVAQALALIADDVRNVVTRDVLIKPNLVSHRFQPPSTHVDTFSATLDAVFAGGARNLTVAEGASDATAGFDRFGFTREAEGLPVRFMDLNRDETDWEMLTLTGVDGTRRDARVSATVAGSECRVSLALAKTHVTAMVTLSLKNMLSSIHPSDRVMMHGHAGGGNGYHGWKRLAVEFLKGDNLAVRALTRLMGRVRNGRNVCRELALGRERRISDLSTAELGYLRSVDAMNRNLAALAGRTKPHLSVVDGFVGMHREGPRHGTPIALRTVIAGTDAVAVDAVAAAVMGFDPSLIGYLVYAEAAGLEPPTSTRSRSWASRSRRSGGVACLIRDHPVQKLWPQLGRPALRARTSRSPPRRNGSLKGRCS